MIRRPPRSTLSPYTTLSRSDRRNPETVISREALIRSVDYNLDPLSGELFLLRPVSTLDRKSTRLNSSHANISYAVFCLKKKNRPVHLDFRLQLRILLTRLPE